MGFVVLRTKVQNGFCPMCTKRCYMVLTCSKPFWGQFWGRIGEINSYPHHSNKRAVLVPLRNADTYIAGFSQVKSPTNQYISFTLRQKVVRKHYSAALLHTAPSPRETPLFGRIRGASAQYPLSQNTAQNFPLSRDFCFTAKAFRGLRPRPRMP